MSDKINEIIICLGSSCFARGNKKTLSLIQQYLEDHNLKDKVVFKGNHCFGKCHNGPNLKINGRDYEGINEADIIPILEKELGTLNKI
ncbi:MAG: (2Fe-2S) ferredoxin domain-containing protein [Bacteroidales bacterium]